MKRLLRSFLLLAVLALPLFANAQVRGQSVDPSLIRAEISKRGLREEDVQKKLLSKGLNYDINNIKPEELLRARSAIEAAIAELESERKAAETVREPTQEEVEQGRINKEIEVKATQRAEEKAQKIASEKVDAAVKEEVKEVAKSASKEIKKAIATGSTLEEALTEKLTDAANNKGTPSTMFGQEYFQNGNLSAFRLGSEPKVPDTYILGASDQVTVSVTGRSFYNQQHTITKDGYIQPDRMNRVYLKGMSVSSARRVLATMFRQFMVFTPEEFVVSVSGTRTISVNIVGEVKSPGSYTISATNSGFNALVAAGGPTDIGSLRKMELIRSNGERKPMDLYEYLNNPSSAKDFFLYENDYIRVPAQDRVVTISGAVRRPFKYELIGGENLKKLIQYAGGLSDNAQKVTAQIKRFVTDREEIFDVNMEKLDYQDFEVKNGDVISIGTINVSAINVAEIIGAVQYPGSFEIRPNMRVSDMLVKAILKPSARTDAFYIQRLRTDGTTEWKSLELKQILNNPNSEANISLQSKDKIWIFEQSRYVEQEEVMSFGSIRTPLRVPYDSEKKMRVSDLVILSGGAKPEATDFAYVFRKNKQDTGKITYIRVDLKKALANPKSADDIVLEGQDELRIPSILTYTNRENIKISGAVRTPGEYAFGSQLNIKDLILLAGGFKLEAAKNRIDVFRVNIIDNEPVRTTVASIEMDKDYNIIQDQGFSLQPYDQIVVRVVPEFSFQKIINLTGEVKYPGAYALIRKNEKLADVIKRAGGLSLEAFPEGATIFRADENVGYVIVDMVKALKDTTSNFNHILKDGDLIDIPKSRDLVTITGATKAIELYPEKVLQGGKVNVPFHNGRRAFYYVDRYAAGIGKEGKRSSITVTHPNGRIERTKDYGLFKIYPKVERGSIVNVGYRERKEKDKVKKNNADVDWQKVISNTFAQITSVVTVLLLLRQLQ